MVHIGDLEMTENKQTDTWDPFDLDPDQEMTDRQASVYAEQVFGVRLPTSRLQRSRIGLCPGPRYLKVDGWGVRYTPRLLDEYFQDRQSCVIDPARRAAAS